jgi:SAM-dependent methyltransferase
MGVAAPEMNWVPAPTYVLRRAAILDWLKDLPPGRLLEVGCGAGAMLHEFARDGFSVVGVEVSETSRRIAEKMVGSLENVVVRDALPDGEEGSFDYLMSFEVLEHIADDRAALGEWLRYLKPGGIVLLSVPAHSNRWNVTDLAAGHFRRYNRSDAEELVRSLDLRIERCGTYGWPLSAFNEWLRLQVVKQSLRRQGIDPATIQSGDSKRTMASGSDRRLEKRLYPYYGGLAGRILFNLAISLQRPFYDTSLGISFLILARKPAHAG